MSNWKITYMGDGIAQLDGIGNFQKHTTASVTEKVANGLKGDTRWTVVGPGSPAQAPAAAAKVEEKPAAKAEPLKADEKKAEPPKADEKKAEPPKADEKKAEPPKADEKKAEPPKADEKKKADAPKA